MTTAKFIQTASKFADPCRTYTNQILLEPQGDIGSMVFTNGIFLARLNLRGKVLSRQCIPLDGITILESQDYPAWQSVVDTTARAYDDKEGEAGMKVYQALSTRKLTNKSYINPVTCEITEKETPGSILAKPLYAFANACKIKSVEYLGSKEECHRFRFGPVDYWCIACVDNGKGK